jgi:hypothetical protein
LEGAVGAHNDYYAINPRRVGGMVEKSAKKPFCDAKYGKNWVFLGDGLLGPKRGTSNINDLRAPQATPQIMCKMAAPSCA